jgi:hypothetical protein
MEDAIAQQQMLAVAETIEKAVDDELERIDMMDDQDMAVIRRNRLKQVLEMQKRKDTWVARGHGRYHEITEEKEFFDFVKKSERVVVHFGRSATSRCAVVDRHFSELATKHFETLFLRVDCERVPTLPQRFNVLMLPTIMLVEGGNTFHSIIGFDDFGGRDDFKTEVMEDVLHHYGMVNDRDMFANDQTVDE